MRFVWAPNWARKSRSPRKQGADEQGWYFLTDSSAETDRALGGLKMTREKEPDGSIAHIEAMFPVGADGRELHEYGGEPVRPGKFVNAVNKSLSDG